MSKLPSPRSVPSVTRSTTALINDENVDETCLLCASPCAAFGVFECGHFTCHLCALRLRRMAIRAAAAAAAATANGGSGAALPAPVTCPTCRHVSSRVFVCNGPPTTTDDNIAVEAYDVVSFVSLNQIPFPELGVALVDMTPPPQGQVGAKPSSALASLRAALQILDGLYCPYDECWPDGSQVPFERLSFLKQHLRNVHGVTFCECCIDYRPVFLSEQILYTDAELNQHFKGACASKDSAAFTGHPRCLFCKRNMYDGDGLIKHMNTSQHVTCDLCNIGEFKFTYYKDHPSLFRHFEVQHRVCQHKDCAHKATVGRVFKNDMDLQAHMAREHGGSAKVGLHQLGFVFSSMAAMDSSSQAASRSSNAGAAAAASNLTGAPATGANIQAAKVYFDFVTHVEEMRLVPQRRDDEVLAERDRVQGAHSSQEQADNDLRLQELLQRLLKPDAFASFQQASRSYLEGRLLATEYYSKFRDLFKNADDHDTVFEPLVRSLPNALKRDALVKAKQMMTCAEVETRRRAAEDDERQQKSQRVKSIHKMLQEQQRRGHQTPAQIKSALAKAGASHDAPATSWAAAAASATRHYAQPSAADIALGPVLSSGRGRGVWQGNTPPPATVTPPPPPQPPAVAAPPTYTDPTAFPALQSSSRSGRVQPNPNPKKAGNVWFVKNSK